MTRHWPTCRSILVRSASIAKLASKMLSCQRIDRVRRGQCSSGRDLVIHAARLRRRGAEFSLNLLRWHMSALALPGRKPLQRHVRSRRKLTYRQRGTTISAQAESSRDGNRLNGSVAVKTIIGASLTDLRRRTDGRSRTFGRPSAPLDSLCHCTKP